MDEKRINLVSGMIVDSAYRIHKRLGPGLFESAYCKLLAADLARRGLTVETEKSISFEYDGIKIHDAYRVDILVEGTILVEVKSITAFAAIHEKQMLTYMRLMECPLGLMFNFSSLLLKNGIKRYRLAAVGPQVSSE